MRLIATRQHEIEQRLFDFLVSVYDRRPRAFGPILIGASELSQLYAQPNPQMLTVLRECLGRFLQEISPKSPEFGDFKVPASVLGLAVSAHNTLPDAKLPLSMLSAGPRRTDPVETCTKALIASVPAAKSMPEILLYHCLLRDVTPKPESWPQPIEKPVDDLIGKSPLTTLMALDGYRIPELEPLASELLKAKSSVKPGARKRKRRSSWELAVEKVIGHPQLAGWLRRQWLDLPETRRSCRNLGLILETLRRKSNYRGFLLEFYEAYERITCSGKENGPVFVVIEEHLGVQGSSDATLQLNRWGNEYLIKFLPLIETIIAEEGLPKDYRHLTPRLANAIRRLLPYATWNIDRKIQFTPVAFGNEAAP